MTVLLEVKSLQKVYTTRFGGNSVTALSNAVSYTHLDVYKRQASCCSYSLQI